jgi:hypothetical protein
MIKDFMIFVICVSLFNSFYLPFSFGEAGPSLLGDKHKVAGISCEGCHKENPPKEQVPTPVSNECHGNQKKIVEISRNVAPNPHDSHLGNLKCELCHHAHKPSEAYCNTCHELNLRCLNGETTL